MNIKKLSFIAASVLLFSMFSCSKKNTTGMFSSAMTNMQEDVIVLADDNMEGREVGTPGERKAAAFVEKRMKALQLKGMGENGYYDSFEKIIKANPHSMEASPDDEKIEGLNVVGELDNGIGKYIIVGAHFDHLGYGGAGSLAAGVKAIHNGADDNASGVAMMLALADMLNSNGIQENHDIVFIGFSGEEKGLWGSNAFAKAHNELIGSSSFMINMDMVGRLNEERALAINGTGTSPSFKDALEKNNKYNFDLVMSESGVGPSDHTSFYLEDLPVLHFFTGQHEDYHKPSDDADKLNYAGMKDVASYIYHLIMDLDKTDDLTFTKTKDESSSAPKFTVTLGVVPDYLYSGRGMRIDGVREGKPAHKADIQKGDVVIQMGDIEVVDMMSYMEGLSKFQPGDETTVIIMRDDKTLKKKIVF